MRPFLLTAALCVTPLTTLSAQAMRIMMARPMSSNDTSWIPAARRTPVQLKVTALDGRIVDLAAWRGKVVAIELWSLVECDQCTEQEDALKAVYAKYHAQGFEVLRVVVGDSTIDRSMLDEEITRNEVKWPVTFTPSWDREAVLKPYHLDFLPGLVLYDQKGHFVSNSMSADDLDAYLKTAFAPIAKPKK